jgi:predicted acylesterase/phospholipase RssA
MALWLLYLSSLCYAGNTSQLCFANFKHHSQWCGQSGVVFWYIGLRVSASRINSRFRFRRSHLGKGEETMFRILALDGGGIKGAFSAAVLQQFERQLGRSLIDHFDLTVGTSTGGITALALACGLKASRIVTLYKEDGEKIFPPANCGWTGLIKSIFDPKFDNGSLRAVLLKHLPDRPFLDLRHNIAITAFDAACARPVVFKTRYHVNLNGYPNLGVVDVALATSAAPVYFGAAKIGCGIMIDGGVWANCPVMVAVTEALSLFRQNIGDIYILSVGTTTIPTFVSENAREGGVVHWARPATSLLMHAAKLGAIEQAKKLSKELVRVDEVVEPDRFDMDDVSQVDDLVRLGWNAGRQAWNKVEPIFFSERRSSNRKAAGWFSEIMRDKLTKMVQLGR